MLALSGTVHQASMPHISPHVAGVDDRGVLDSSCQTLDDNALCELSQSLKIFEASLKMICAILC